jgi:phage terminase large subunit
VGIKLLLFFGVVFRGKVYTYKQQGLDITSGLIERLRLENGVPVSNVIVDEDGLGGGLVDFMKYRGFINNSRPMPSPDRPYNDNGQLVYENYDNLKSQCYYRLSEIINRNEMYIEIADKEKQDLVEELEQVKMKDLNSDMKKGVVQKDIVKQNIGRSPDISDAIMMRMFFELVPKRIFLDAKY